MERGNIVYLGTGEFAVPLLEELHRAGEKIALVVTQPDRPRGRGRSLQPTPVKRAALELGLEVKTPENVNAEGFVAEMGALEPEFLVLADYGQLLKAPVLTLAKHGAINLHPSLLPRWRGPAPVAYTILEGDKEGGATIMVMDEGMDTGPILAQERVELAPGVTCGELTEELCLMGSKLLAHTLDEVRAGRVSPAAQDHSKATVSKLIGRELRTMEWSLDHNAAANRINALAPHPGVRAWLGAKMVKLLRARPAAGGGKPGEVLSRGSDGITVACGTGAIELLTVQPEGKRAMDAASFARGHQITPGMAFEAGESSHT